MKSGSGKQGGPIGLEKVIVQGALDTMSPGPGRFSDGGGYGACGASSLETLARLSPESRVGGESDRRGPPYKAARTHLGRNEVEDAKRSEALRPAAAGLEGRAAHPAHPGKANKKLSRGARYLIYLAPGIDARRAETAFLGGLGLREPNRAANAERGAQFQPSVILSALQETRNRRPANEDFGEYTTDSFFVA